MFFPRCSHLLFVARKPTEEPLCDERVLYTARGCASVRVGFPPPVVSRGSVPVATCPLLVVTEAWWSPPSPPGGRARLAFRCWLPSVDLRDLRCCSPTFLHSYLILPTAGLRLCSDKGKAVNFVLRLLSCSWSPGLHGIASFPHLRSWTRTPLSSVPSLCLFHTPSHLLIYSSDPSFDSLDISAALTSVGPASPTHSFLGCGLCVLRCHCCGHWSPSHLHRVRRGAVATS